MPKPRKHAVGAARAALVRSACTLFSERGFEGASTHEIAGRARVPQGLIRHHFGSKEALWRELVASRLGDLNTALEQPRRARGLQVDPVATWTEVLLEQRELVQLLLHALFEPGPRRTWLVAELIASAPVRALIAWARGDEERAQSADHDVVRISARVGSLCAVPALLAVLETLRGHAIDATTVASAQRDAFGHAVRVAARSAVAGPWSLAAAAQRRASATPSG